MIDKRPVHLLPYLILAFSGCCSYAHPSKYFDRIDPLATVNGFIYAIDTGHWDFAYDCLSTSSQKAITRTQLKFFLKFADDPQTGNSVWNLIQQAVPFDRKMLRWQGGAPEAVLALSHEGEDAQGVPIYRQVNLYLILETREEPGPLWRIDLERTIREQGGGEVSLR
ncbi:MAG: hypothetical protein HY717_00240 [Planctomycetes bacterium]|nr:hypothetical protein [Planctomycetota bacterium]